MDCTLLTCKFADWFSIRFGLLQHQEKKQKETSKYWKVEKTWQLKGGTLESARAPGIGRLPRERAVVGWGSLTRQSRAVEAEAAPAVASLGQGQMTLGSWFSPSSWLFTSSCCCLVSHCWLAGSPSFLVARLRFSSESPEIGRVWYFQWARSPAQRSKSCKGLTGCCRNKWLWTSFWILNSCSF